MLDFIYNNVFTLGGQGVTLIELISVISGLICVFLAGRNNKYNFWVGYVYNIFLFVMFMHKSLYSAMLLQPIALSMNILGHWRWSHPHENEKSNSDSNSLKVTSMSWTERGILALTVAICSLLWGYVLDNLGINWFVGTFTPDPMPYLDAFILMLTMAALYLSAQKKWDCWIVWLFVNTFNIILYISAGLVFMPIVSGLYLLNGIWSLWTWYSLYKKGN